MSSQLFRRKARLTIGTASLGEAFIVEGLRMEFTVQKSLDKAPNSLELTVTNLSPMHRARLQAKGTEVVLEAGYDSNAAVIFSGEIRHANSVREGANWNSKVKCGDGDTAFSTAHVSESFGPGVGVPDVVKKIAGKMGLKAGNLLQKLTGVSSQVMSFSNGYSACGRAATELERVLAPLGLSYSIQDGALLLLGEADVEAGTAATVLSPSTGLIGSPELGTPDKKKGRPVLKAATRLQPTIRPGGRIEVQSAGVNGQFKVIKVTHTGDTASTAWETQVEATRI